MSRVRRHNDRRNPFPELLTVVVLPLDDLAGDGSCAIHEVNTATH
jgi:hypothetical protein